MASIRRDNLVERPKDGIPSGFYTVAVGKAEAKKSSKGNDMVVAEVEIIAPDFVEHAGARIKVAGQKCTKYFVINDNKENIDAVEQLTGVQIQDGDSADIARGFADFLAGKIIRDVELERQAYERKKDGQPVIGPDGQKEIGYSFDKKRAAAWPQAHTREELGMPY